MNTTLAALDNEALLAATRSLVARSNATEVELLLHLGEVDKRRLYAELGFSSMHRYCTELLGFSTYVALDRIGVARLANQHPDLLKHLAAGRLNVTSLKILASLLSKEDAKGAERIAARAFGLTTKNVAELAAELEPKPLLADSARKLPSPTPAPPVPPLELPLAPPPSPVAVAPPPAAVAVAPEPPRPPPPAPELKVKAQPLAADAYGIRFTADKETYELLLELQALLSHRKDKRDFGSIIKQALTHELAAVKKERFGIGAKPRAKKEPVERPAAKATRHVPAETLRAVVEREGLTCGFVSADGRRCAERAFLQVEHLEGFARTGVHDQDQMALRCAAHNLLSAERMYGREKMDAMRRGARFEPSETAQGYLLDFDPAESLEAPVARFEPSAGPGPTRFEPSTAPVNHSPA